MFQFKAKSGFGMMHQSTLVRLNEAASKEVPGYILITDRSEELSFKTGFNSQEPLYKLKGGIRGISGAVLYVVLSDDKKKVLAINETAVVTDKPQFRRVAFKESAEEFAKKASSKDYFLPASFLGLNESWSETTAKEALKLYRKKLKEELKSYGADLVVSECSVLPRDPLLKISVTLRDSNGIAAMFQHSFTLQKDGNVLEEVSKHKKLITGAFVPMSLLSQGGSGNLLKTVLSEELGKRNK